MKALDEIDFEFLADLLCSEEAARKVLEVQQKK